MKFIPGLIIKIITWMLKVERKPLRAQGVAEEFSWRPLRLKRGGNR